MKDYASITEKLRAITCPTERREISWAEEQRRKQMHLARELRKALAALGPRYVFDASRHLQRGAY